ncbi:MAG TPA: peptide chain release factor N(5)-glutamine methyltransferase [Vicinamibacterales bacterium]|nr:peptide chain release factor N(5)-glutamine methyltransferase [Vicinamibacterales bacterium]
MTLFETLAAARHQLIAAGIPAEEAAIDVPLFACTILGWDRAHLIAARSQETPPALEPRFSDWIARRVAHEPAAYIVGHREFWGLDFIVSPAVLIPRPETELIVEEAVDIVRLRGFAAMARQVPVGAIDTLRMADIGTGSGNLAVSLAHEIHGSGITATDISRDAIAIARQNAQRHDVDDRIEFVETAFLDGIDDVFDLIVANPPYVKATDRTALAPAVLHEPAGALFAGERGLDAISGVLDAAARTLASNGWLLMEFGFGQEEDIHSLVGQRPALRLERIRNDLQGIPRTAIIQRGR